MAAVGVGVAKLVCPWCIASLNGSSGCPVVSTFDLPDVEGIYRARAAPPPPRPRDCPYITQSYWELRTRKSAQLPHLL